ncbi:DUF6538 domain-containing protein [Microvirga sp. P5_D2]
MSDSVSASTNLTKRGSTYQFVLRVPKDVVDEIGKRRIQFSLGTGNEIEARRLALPEAEKWEKRFAEIRAKKGLVAERPVAGALDTTGWTWPAWEALAAWWRHPCSRTTSKPGSSCRPGTAWWTRLKWPGGGRSGSPGRRATRRPCATIRLKTMPSSASCGSRACSVCSASGCRRARLTSSVSSRPASPQKSGRPIR